MIFYALINEGTRKQDKETKEIKAFMLGKEVYAWDFIKSVQGTKYKRAVVTGRLGDNIQGVP